jgi:hypothetical protein
LFYSIQLQAAYLYVVQVGSKTALILVQCKLIDLWGIGLRLLVGIGIIATFVFVPFYSPIFFIPKN